MNPTRGAARGKFEALHKCSRWNWSHSYFFKSTNLYSWCKKYRNLNQIPLPIYFFSWLACLLHVLNYRPTCLHFVTVSLPPRNQLASSCVAYCLIFSARHGQKNQWSGILAKTRGYPNRFDTAFTSAVWVNPFADYECRCTCRRSGKTHTRCLARPFWYYLFFFHIFLFCTLSFFFLKYRICTKFQFIKTHWVNIYSTPRQLFIKIFVLASPLPWTPETKRTLQNQFGLIFGFKLNSTRFLPSQIWRCLFLSFWPKQERRYRKESRSVERPPEKLISAYRK